MSIIYAGDLHGDLSAIEKIDQLANKSNAKAIVQVGDFGCRWLPNVDEYFTTRTSQVPWYTCGGNHDNYDNWEASPKVAPNLTELLPNVYWAARGTCHNIDGIKHLFLGGAVSTDKHRRTAGVDWWPQEEPTNQELQMFCDALDNEMPDVVVTHDGPQDIVTNVLGLDWGSNLARDLQNINNISSHRPTFWAFGHYHKLMQVGYYHKLIQANLETTYACCGLHGEVVQR